MRFLLLICTVLLLTNCDKTEYITMAYNETECSDPWSVAISTNETELLKEIETYFKTTYEISFIDVATKLEDLKLKCFSCDCPTGRKFFVRVDEAFVEILQDENFYLE